MSKRLYGSGIDLRHGSVLNQVWGKVTERGAGKRSTTCSQPLLPALHPCCSLTLVLFEMRQEMSDWVTGSVNAQALTDA